MTHEIYYETCCIIHQERNLKDFKQVLIQLYFTKNDKRNVLLISNAIKPSNIGRGHKTWDIK